MPAFESGITDSDDEFKKADRLAARAARFSKNDPAKRNRELEEARKKERKAFEERGLINSGKTDLGDAVDMRGTCEGMCSGFEAENRTIRGEVHPFERDSNGQMDLPKAVAAYTRSDAGAGHGEAAILPSDLRTPVTLVRTLDYLFSQVMNIPPPASSSKSAARKALGYSAGFIRDRSRAIRKEFAMQSSWGHEEAIASFERIARWHILCLRELQEESGTNSDMHIDSAELGRCFTSLRQHYNDRREETGLEMPCSNEPEFRAYMLIFDLANKSVSIPTAELPSIILDHPLVKLAWEIRKTAQRNFDSQKEGSKLNSELGANSITLFVRLLRQPKIPFLLSCLVEVRLREIRRSAIRALTRTYPRLKADPIRVNEMGQVVERRMILIDTLSKILGCGQQEDEESAFDDVSPASDKPRDEAVDIIKAFDIEVYSEGTNPVGALVHLGALYNDNRDAPFTRRWQSITAKRERLLFVDIVNGKTGVQIDGVPSSVPKAVAIPTTTPAVKLTKPSAVPVFSFAPPPQSFTKHAEPPKASAFNFASSLASAPKASPVEIQPSPVPPSAPAALPSFFQSKATTPPLPKPPESQPLPPPLAPSFTFTAATPIMSKSPSPAPVTPSLPPPIFATPISTQEASSSSTILGDPFSPAQTAPSPVKTSLTTSTKRRNLRLSTSTEAERRKREYVYPLIRDMLIHEVLSARHAQLRPELTKLVKQEMAARAYSYAKTKRKEWIDDHAQIAFSTLLDELVREVAGEALLEEISQRHHLRRVIFHWRRWARQQAQTREDAKQDREDLWKSLRGMGLGAETAIAEDNEDASASAESNEDEEFSDEFGKDIALQLAERAKEHFFSSGTFYDTTARLIQPRLAQQYPAYPGSDTDEAPPIEFTTILSTARSSASPASPQAQEWLERKFLPPPEQDQAPRDGILFDARILDLEDEIPETQSVGLVVLEAAGPVQDVQERVKNQLDVQDRLYQLVELGTQMANQYMAPLLIVTWGNETLEELVARLEIDSITLNEFPKVAVLSLESADDLDERFASALESLIRENPLRKRVTLSPSDAVEFIMPEWQKLLSALDYLTQERPTDVDIALWGLAVGVECINRVPVSIRSTFGDKLDPKSAKRLAGVTLPSFTPGALDDPTAKIEAIASYLQSEAFSGLSDVLLFVTPLYQALELGKPLPVVGILQALAVYGFGELANLVIPLQAYTDFDPMSILRPRFQQIHRSYATTVNDSISVITALVPRAVDESPASPRHSSPPSSRSTVFTTPSSKGSLKRPRPSSSSVQGGSPGKENQPEGKASAHVHKNILESKASKNARLLRMMEEVERTLVGMEVDSS